MYTGIKASELVDIHRPPPNARGPFVITGYHRFV